MPVITMKPSLMQRFFANDWPLKMWLAACSLAAAILAWCACDPTFAAFRDWYFTTLFLVAMLVAPILGFFLALPFTYAIVGPLYGFRGWLNGGPFKVGDYVQIIAGEYSGKIGQIYSTWQGDTFRVELGPEAEESFKNIFSQTKVIRSASPDTSLSITAIQK